MRTPTERPSDNSRSPSDWKRVSEMITSPGGRPWSSDTWVNGSSARTKAPSAWSLMRVGIDGLLERGDAGAAHGVEEALLALAFAQIDVDQDIDGLGHAVGRQGRAQHGAYRRVLGAGAAQGQLVEFLALLIDAQDADMADVVVAAGVDAATDLD